MTADYVEQIGSQRGGFNFENYPRNFRLFNDSKAPLLGWLPPARKTGTTICGVVCDGGVVLGADTRATEGSIVADKNCKKLHSIAGNIYCAGAGTSADLDHCTEWIASRVELHRLNTHTQPRVAMVVSMLSHDLFRYQGYKGCALVLGGVDVTGPSLYTIHPHGSTDRGPFATMGSGSLNAMAVLERGYKDGMSIEEGKALACAAIRAGIFNDLGSGSNVDLCVMTGQCTELLRGFDMPNPRLFRMPQPVTFPKGTTPLIREKIEKMKQLVDIIDDEDVEMHQERVSSSIQY